MQNAKDSFYDALRKRLAALNPERTISLRGVTRPALVTDENESQNAAALPDCFHLRWIESGVELNSTLPVVALRCEISYDTAGNGLNGGLDRGRVLAAMDAELVSALGSEPQNAPKQDFSLLGSGGVASRMATRIWWSCPTPGKVTTNHDRIGRVLTVEVMSFAEAGELR